jgi:hypothetical protein
VAGRGRIRKKYWKRKGRMNKEGRSDRKEERGRE